MATWLGKNKKIEQTKPRNHQIETQLQKVQISLIGICGFVTKLRVEKAWK